MQASVFGCTGSVGINSIDVLTHLDIPIVALAAGSNVHVMEDLARRCKPRVAALFDESAASELKVALADTDITVLGGEDGVLEAATVANDIWINAIVGIAGLRPTLAAIENTQRIALANKETLVCAGKMVLDYAKRKGVDVIPVDSEHSAIFQAIQGSKKKQEIEKILLTASGGPFFGKTSNELKNVSLSDALKHPNWSMGSKITIDSATMMNKGLEIIEAVHLFDVSPEKIEVLVHRESIVHSMVEFVDGSVIAQLGVADMRIPIQYAITYPERVKSSVAHVDFLKIASLTFNEPDYETFPCLAYAIDAVKEGGGACVRLNAANEAAVSLLLNGKIEFYELPQVVHRAITDIDVPKEPNIDEIFEIDTAVRRYVLGGNNY